MRLGFDARFVTFSGIGTYSRNLIHAFAAIDKKNDYFLFCYQKDKHLLPVQANFYLEFVSDKPFSLFPPRELTQKINQNKLDLFHSPHFIIPGKINCPLVVTLHDLIPLQMPASMPSFWRRFVYWHQNKRAAKRAAAIIVPSQASKQIVKQMLKPQCEIKVIYESVDPFFLEVKAEGEKVLAQYGLKKPYLLTVGNSKPHKNWVGLIKAFAQLRPQFPELSLVLVGENDSRFPAAKEEVKKQALEDKVFFLSYVQFSDLPLIYHQAELFVFPSFLEGFGLPPLEAMACSLPVIAANSSAVAEVVDEAALLVDPANPQEIAEGVRQVLTDENLKRDLITKGTERLNQFSWQRAAQETVALYQAV